MNQRLLVDVIVTDDYVVRYEQVDEITLVHVLVRKWSPAIAKRFRWDIDAAQNLLNRPVYAVHDGSTSTLPKFLRLHGFEPCGEVLSGPEKRPAQIFGRSFDGRLVRWVLDQHSNQLE